MSITVDDLKDMALARDAGELREDSSAFVGRRSRQASANSPPGDEQRPHLGGPGLEHKGQWAFAGSFYSGTGAHLRQERARFLLNKTNENLRNYGWLGDFEPLPSNCPLFARRISAEAVPELAMYAWHCDGLGFSWHCLARAGARAES
jgi:hypothetical protein